MEAVTELKQSSQSKSLNFFEFSRVSPGAHRLTKKPEDSGYEIGNQLISQPRSQGQKPWERGCLLATSDVCIFTLIFTMSLFVLLYTRLTQRRGTRNLWGSSSSFLKGLVLHYNNSTTVLQLFSSILRLLYK